MGLTEFREELRRKRELRVGSREKLASLVRPSPTGEPLDPQTIYRIETDESYFPKLDTLDRLLEAMGLSLNLRAKGDNDRASPAFEGRHGSQGNVVHLGDLKSIVEAISVAALTAIAAAQNREPPPEAESDEPDRHDDRPRLD